MTQPTLIIADDHPLFSCRPQGSRRTPDSRRADHRGVVARCAAGCDCQSSRLRHGPPGSADARGEGTFLAALPEGGVPDGTIVVVRLRRIRAWCKGPWTSARPGSSRSRPASKRSASPSARSWTVNLRAAPSRTPFEGRGTGPRAGAPAVDLDAPATQGAGDAGRGSEQQVHRRPSGHHRGDGEGSYHRESCASWESNAGPRRPYLRTPDADGRPT